VVVQLDIVRHVVPTRVELAPLDAIGHFSQDTRRPLVAQKLLDEASRLVQLL
jgi:hypothetical protein